MSSLPSSIVPLLQDDPNRLPTTTTTESPKKLALIPFIFLIYFEVSGGPFGEESTVGAAGPLFAILGFLIFPFIWCIPEALVTAELSTTFPGNGGSVIWAHKAFGPFMGSLMGFWKLLSGIINMAAYPVLGVDYLKRVFPIFSSGVPRYMAIVILTLFLSFVNYTGLTIVAYTALCLGIISLCPILALTLISIPKLVPARWFSLGQKGIKKDWTLFFNTLFWNLNSWDNASTLAGEVDQPQKTYPKAIFSAVIFVCLAYLFPLLAATGALPLNQENWTNGYLATAGQLIGGKWLKDWIELGAALSVIGSYEAQLSSCAYQVLGMADLGVVPFFFGVRSKWFNTPWIGIFIATLIALAVSFLNFADIVSSVNFLYSLGMMVEFASFLWLRRVMRIRADRSYKVPLPMSGLVIMCLVPCGFLVYVVTIATKTVYLISALLTVVGIVWYFLMKLCKARNWVKFNDHGERGEGEDEDEDFE